MLGLLFRLLARILCRRSISAEAARILLLRVDERMGNLVLTTPLLAELRSLYPLARIDVMAASRYAALLADNDYDIGVVPFDKRALFRRPLSWLRLMLGLRGRAYDIVIDASHEHELSLTSALLTLWSGAPLRIGHARGGSEFAYTHAVQPPQDEILPEAWRKLRLLDVLDTGEHQCRPWLGRNQITAEVWADDWLREKNESGKRVLLVFTGARKIDRRILARDFSFIPETLAGRADWKVVLVGGRGEADELTAMSHPLAGCDFSAAPELDLHHLWALLACCDVFVCADTGPLHLAWALEKPLLSLHGAGSVARWGHAEGISRALPFVSGDEQSRHSAALALSDIIDGLDGHENT